MINKIIYITKNFALLKTIQKKRIKRILNKAKYNEELTNKEVGYLEEARRTIRCQLVNISMTTNSKLRKVRNNPYKTSVACTGIESKHN